jgi:hypothetical protein
MHAEHLSHALTELENRDEFIGRHIGPDEHAIGRHARLDRHRFAAYADRRNGAGHHPPAAPADLPAAMPEHAALAA